MLSYTLGRLFKKQSYTVGTCLPTLKPTDAAVGLKTLERRTGRVTINKTGAKVGSGGRGNVSGGRVERVHACTEVRYLYTPSPRVAFATTGPTATAGTGWLMARRAFPLSGLHRQLPRPTWAMRRPRVPRQPWSRVRGALRPPRPVRSRRTTQAATHTKPHRVGRRGERLHSAEGRSPSPSCRGRSCCGILEEGKKRG